VHSAIVRFCLPHTPRKLYWVNMCISDKFYKACSKKRPNFCYKDFILQHFKHCPLQSSPLYWRYTVHNVSFTVGMLPARAQFSGCSSTTNAHSETGQMAVCCQNLPLGALSSRSAPSLLVGELFKKFGLFLNTGVFRIFYLQMNIFQSFEPVVFVTSAVLCIQATRPW
jgi:hypothetical protein